MRIEIKTNGKVKDTDIKALYLLKHALELLPATESEYNDYINTKR